MYYLVPYLHLAPPLPQYTIRRYGLAKMIGKVRESIIMLGGQAPVPQRAEQGGGSGGYNTRYVADQTIATAKLTTRIAASMVLLIDR